MLQNEIGQFLYEDVLFEALIDNPQSDENGTNIGYHVPEGTIIFDRASIDTEGSMNVTSGTFTATKDGVYLFNIDGHKCAGSSVAEIDVERNGSLIHKVLH